MPDTLRVGFGSGRPTRAWSSPKVTQKLQQGTGSVIGGQSPMPSVRRG